jgi:phosphoadenosine phosphosulfate reductase
MTSLSAVLVRLEPAGEPAPRPVLREAAQEKTIVAHDDGATLPLWRNGRFEADEWTLAGEDDAVSEGPAILPLERYLAERESLTARNAPLGVLVKPDEAVEELAPHLDRLALVVLTFPKFADGRSMSIARLLRERYGFAGEIRATGDVLIDQMPLMRRCGFDAFEVTNGPTRAQLAAGKWPDMPNYLQPVGSSAQAEIPAGTRPWARKPGRAD